MQTSSKVGPAMAYLYTLVCKNSAFEIYIPYAYTFCISMKYLMTPMGP